jgi:hypothetical protein
MADVLRVMRFLGVLRCYVRDANRGWVHQSARACANKVRVLGLPLDRLRGGDGVVVPGGHDVG